MKADLTGLSNIDTIIGTTHGPKTVKKVIHARPARSTDSSLAVDLPSIIERADRKAAKVSQKLQEMVELLNQMKEEKNDIIREQLARFFNVLRAYIEEALHPTGDWSTDQIMSGKNIKVNIEVGGASIIVQGERIDFDKLGIRELSSAPTNEDLETLQQNIKKAHASLKSLRGNLASARHMMAHHAQGSGGLTL